MDESKMREEIIKMAREAGCDVQEDYVAYCDVDDLVSFFHMAQAAEREACAKVCDEFAARDKLSNYYQIAAKAIRERGNI